MDVQLRLAERRDAEAIRAIYNPEVLESTVTFDLVPRSLDDQLAWLDDHSGGHPAIVATDAGGDVTGFGSLSPYRPRAAYSTTVEDSVYVRHDCRGRGIGAAPDGAGPAGDGARLPLRDRQDRRPPRSVDRAPRPVRIRDDRHRREVGRKFGRWLDVVLMQRML